MINLVNIGKQSIAKLLLDREPSLRDQLIRRLSTPEHAKVAADYVKDYKLNPEDFPEL